MYSRGDQIIHPRYGAGTIVGKKKMTFMGKIRNYHIVELVGDRGEVMIPVEAATDMNIRPAIQDLSIIEKSIRRAALGSSRTIIARGRRRSKSKFKRASRMLWRWRCAIYSGANKPTNSHRLNLR